MMVTTVPACLRERAIAILDLDPGGWSPSVQHDRARERATADHALEVAWGAAVGMPSCPDSSL